MLINANSMKKLAIIHRNDVQFVIQYYGEKEKVIMERFKDFLYNKNDILVALIILAIAAAVIVFRIDAIMEYPKALVEQQMQTVEENTANVSPQEEAPAQDGAEK